MLDNGKKLLLLGFSILFFSIPFFVEAFEVEYPEISGTQITQASTLPEYFFYIYKFGVIIGFIAVLLMLKDHFYSSLINFDKTLVKPILKDSLPFALASFLGAIMINTDLIMPGHTLWMPPKEAATFCMEAIRPGLLNRCNRET